MTTTTRTAALGALAALMLAFGSPGDAAAHSLNFGPNPHVHLDVRRAQARPHDTIVVSWEGHHGATTPVFDYRLFVRDADEEAHDPQTCAVLQPERRPPDGCISRIVSLTPEGSYSETITGLQPDTTYFVWPIATWISSGGQLVGYTGWSRGLRKTITTLPRQTTATPPPSHSHPLPAHAHDYAAASHSHSYAVPGHVHATRRHTHEYAAADHTHDSTGTTPGASTTAAQTCPRFIELVSPWTYRDGGAREHVTGSVWIAVDAIEYMRERTVAAASVAGSDEDVEGVEIRLKGTHSTAAYGNGRATHTRSFIDEGAILADVAASVRCQSAPVAVTTEDPPAPGTE